MGAGATTAGVVVEVLVVEYSVVAAFSAVHPTVIKDTPASSPKNKDFGK
jgi:hypothetical protein